MKSILIYLNIPWDFIKQRPQFMAEKLGQYFNVWAFYNKPYKQTYLVKSQQCSAQLNLVAKPKVPRKTAVLKNLDNRLQRVFLKPYIKNCECIWIMHPDQYEIVKNQLKGKQLIYDCMDDYSQFPHLSDSQKEALQKVESELVTKAHYVFYTSKTLQKVHQKRYKRLVPTYVINNGFEPVEEMIEDEPIKQYMDSIEGGKIVYIGAIAKWFDIGLIQRILENNQEIHIILFGPLEIELPKNQRLHHFGKIPHSSIYTAMQDADILMMPFCINALIESVDPIKVYEYIYSGKPVLAPYYEEMKKFEAYISLYHDEEECVLLVDQLMSTERDVDLEQFKKYNTWQARAQQVAEIIYKGE